jgi:Domain of unknown function (DUF4115)
VSGVGRHKLSDILFWLIAGASAALLVTLLLLIAGVIPVGPATRSEDSSPDSLALPQAPSTPAATSVSVQRTTPTGRRTPSAAEPANVVLTAVRGDSWFSARVGSESGRVLAERVLAQGESVRLQATRIWLSIGAAGNVEVTVDGKPAELAPGTVSVVLPAAGASAPS